MDAQRGIARRMVVGLPPDGLSSSWERDFGMYTPAGVILFARDFRDLHELRRLTIRLRELARPRRLFIALDEEGGAVSRLAGHLVVPPNAALLARAAAPGDLEWIARVTGVRLRGLGMDWNLAPVADVHSEANNPVIGPRSYGADPEVVARAAGEIVRGLHAARVLSCLKHFPGHGDTRLDSHLALPTCGIDAPTLERRELVPFRANLEADAMMTAHVVYPALDPERPATFSRAILHGLLRERLRFAGVCITDALEMKGAADGRTPTQAARLALEAGADLLLYGDFTEDVRRVRLDLAKALVDGGLDRAAYDAARPRLVSLDRAQPSPDEAELAAPLDSLTPADWEPRLERIVERGLLLRGALPATAARGTWRVSEPPFPHGPTLREDLVRAGVAAENGGVPAIEVIAIDSRPPLPATELESLRARCRERPVALVGLQNDAFLDAVPEAALRLSASDATPLTRRVVARTLERALRTAAESSV